MFAPLSLSRYTKSRSKTAELIFAILLLIIILIAEFYFQEVAVYKLRWILPTIFGVMLFGKVFKGENEAEKNLALLIIIVVQIFWILFLERKERKNKS